MKNEKWLIALAAGVGAAAVTYSLLSNDIPDGAVPVQPFDKNRFMGTWYEVARLPNFIEKNVRHLTEQYLLNGNDMKVITKGYNVKTNKWTTVTGTMKFRRDESLGMLKVSYFGPFYASYNVLAIDPAYQYAMVSAASLDYLWILSRDTAIPDDIKDQFLATAKQIGFAIEKLQWV